MKKVSKLPCILALGAFISFPAFAGTADFPQYGFQIDTLDGTPGAAPTQAVMMFLPPGDGFSSSVNVQIQPFNSALKEYISLSKKQFEELKFKIISEQQKGEAEWVVEYSGTMQDMQLHWYARAILSNKKIYLATATANEAQWAKIGDQLRKNVNSLKVK